MSRDGFAAIEREAQDARDLRHAEQPAKNYGCPVTQLEFDTLLNRMATYQVALRSVGAASSIFVAREVARRALGAE